MNPSNTFHAAEGSASARLQQYIAARQQSRTPSSTAAANSAFSSYTAAAGQLYIQPLSLAGSPTAASSSPGIASSGRFPAAAAISHRLPGSMQGSAAHAHFFLPGSKTHIGLDSKGWSHMEAGGQNQDESAQRFLAGAAYAHAKLEPFRLLTDKENSACSKFFEMTMGRQQSTSYAEAASILAGNDVKSQQDATAMSQGMHGAEFRLGTAVTRGSEVTNLSSTSDGRLERESSQGRSAARRMKLHAMLDNL